MTSNGAELSGRLQNITSELRDLERELRSEQKLDAQLVQSFRDALDGSRMTAWTVTELFHARQSTANTHLVLSFLSAERIRRFTQMTKDLCADIDNQDITFQPEGIRALSDALDMLQSQLHKLAKK
jgi:hypothetical protein